MSSKRKSLQLENGKDSGEHVEEPPAHKKRHASVSTDSQDDNSDESEEDSDSTNEDDVKEMSINFKAVPPETNDRNGIVALLKQTFRGFSVDLVDLADIIVEQPFVGCVVILETEDDENDSDEESPSSPEALYAVSSIIPLAKYKDRASISGLLKFIGSKCPNVVTDKMVQDPSSIGLLINERLVNIPASIVQHTFPSLKVDLEKASKADPAFAKIKKLLLVSKSMKPIGVKYDTSGYEFANQEEEQLLNFASESNCFKIASRSTDDCTLLGGSWNESDSSSEDSEDSNSDNDGDNMAEGKNEYASYRHVLLLPSDTLSKSTKELFPGVAE